LVPNFTVIDVARTVEATLVLSVVFFVPGYVIAWVSNAFKFRAQSLALRALISTPVAIAIMPIFVYQLGRYPTVLWIFLAMTWAAFLFLGKSAWVEYKQQSESISKSRGAIVGGVFVVGWFLIAIASLVDLQFGKRLYYGVPAYDYSLRTAFTAAAVRAIPPSNPFFANVPPVALHYHYFWMLLCSLATRLSRVGPRQALYGGTIWAGIALMSLVAISLKFFIGASQHFGRKGVIACVLLLVTGLDILPTILLYFYFHTVTADMELWNEQITSWTDSLLWTPHHLMSLVACMIGLLALRTAEKTKMGRFRSVLLAGIAFGSAAGLSILVTFTFVIFVMLWLPYAVLRRWWDDLLLFAASGAVALVVAFPYVHTLIRSGDGSESGHFVAFSIRGFPLAIAVTSSILKIPGSRLFFISLPLLPLNYFLELGFFFLVGVLRMLSIRRGEISMTRNEETGWMIVATSFFVGTFLRSTTIGSNDLGWRCFIPAQLILLLWGALLIDDWWSTRGPAFIKGWVGGIVAVLLVLGAIGTIYQLAMLRAYPILLDKGKVAELPWLDEDRQLGERTYALRSAYDQLSTILPREAVVQYNPITPAYVPHQIYSGHAAAAGGSTCAAAFGGDFSECKSRVQSIEPLFEGKSSVDSAYLDDICQEYGINTILVDDTDPIWKDRDSWVWKRTPSVANDRVRAFNCAGFVQQAKLPAARKQ
jgi:hypothetical protein